MRTYVEAAGRSNSDATPNGREAVARVAEQLMDIVEPDVRSRMMAAVKGLDTKPELTLRRRLHAAGFRYSLHRKDLPGKPDLVLPRHKAVVFVHGCFWHRHQDCRRATTPSTRAEFWQTKFNANEARDARNVSELLASGWRVFTVWECGLAKAASADGTAGQLIELLRHPDCAQAELPER